MALFDDFNGFDEAVWHKADGYTNGEPFNCGWRADHVHFEDGCLKLTLDNAGCPGACSGKPYAGGEYRSNEFFGFGRYEVRMKPAAGSGMVSSFFVYTGVSDGNPHDEVDIEFLGKNTGEVQLNYWVRGQGQHEVIVELGFDAALDFHDYAFDWLPDRIAWFIDGEQVFEYTDAPLPSHPGRIMMNLWPGIEVDEWLGEFRYGGLFKKHGPYHAHYESVRFTPFV